MQKSVQLGDDDADIDVWIEQQRIERRERADTGKMLNIQQQNGD